MTDEAVREETRKAVDAVWRIESAKIVATLTRTVGDLDLAEDLAAMDGAGRTLLELGCGLGLPALVAARAGFTVTAILQFGFDSFDGSYWLSASAVLTCFCSSSNASI